MQKLSDHRSMKPIYRLPPARQGCYLVFSRAEAKFALRSGDVSAVMDFEQIQSIHELVDSPGHYDNLHESDLPIIDIAHVMGAAKKMAGVDSQFLALNADSQVYIAFDEIIGLSTKGKEAGQDSYDELICDMVDIENEMIPLIDISGVSYWVLNKGLHLGVDIDQVFEDIETQLDGLGEDKQVKLNKELDFDHDPGELIEKIQLNFQSARQQHKLYDVCIVGGLGHVGLPFGISLANAGRKTMLYDVNQEAIRTVTEGKMPFLENEAESVLQDVLKRGKLKVSNDKEAITQSYFVVVVIGTPVDEHLNPQFATFKRFIDEIIDYIDDDQHIILRSTVYPGTTEKVHRYLKSLGKQTKISFCPERIIQGNAMEELQNLPQIVSSFDAESVEEAKELFSDLTDVVLELDPMEAELGKLFANVWRYVNFAISNQFYEIAATNGLDYYRIHRALTKNYPRLEGLCTPGFAAGPCLFKDTMQLAAFSNNNFFLGHSAMLINEGLPNYVVQMLKDKYPLVELTVGVLGMAFKPNNDDKRSSLSYKLKKILEIETKEVLCSDVYIHEPGFVSPEELVQRCDIIVVATPHKEYADLQICDQKILVDIWNFYGHGSLF